MLGISDRLMDKEVMGPVLLVLWTTDGAHKRTDSPHQATWVSGVMWAI